MRDELEAAPPGVRPVKGLPVWRWIITSVLVVALAVAAVLVPIPIFYLYVPGPVRDAEDLVEIEQHKTYSSEGSLYMTTVSVDTNVTLLELVVAAADGEQAVVLKDDVTGGSTLEQLREQQKAEMDESQNSARQVALSELGFDRPKGEGALIITTLTGSPADGVLQPDDVIVAVDGQPVATTCEVGAAIGRHQTGEHVRITVLRDGAERSFRLKVERNPFDGSPAYIGAHMQTVNFSFAPGVKVEFKTGQIAGPSAGLMLALALYDQLTPEDLTGGREIAGTGTLECDGGVGPIGGIQQKVAGAQAQGADIFFAPLLNAEEAEQVARDIEIVPVRTFAEAIEYLGEVS
ncbi:MAG TPA: PDZ domain-containing protein [Actinomycetota bacterium]|nr:PDZ domain-containing protein [Actinomycetota bacterium]